MRDEPEILVWIREVDATTTWTISVCTGSLILGAAGLLSGRKATPHWAALQRLLSFGVEPTRLRVVESGKIITAAGVSAGIDMALGLAAKIAGQTVSRRFWSHTGNGLSCERMVTSLKLPPRLAQ